MGGARAVGKCKGPGPEAERRWKEKGEMEQRGIMPEIDSLTMTSAC